MRTLHLWDCVENLRKIRLYLMDQTPASLRCRLTAGVIDTILYGACVAAPVLAAEPSLSSVRTISPRYVGIILVGAGILYGPVAEHVSGGRTIGKAIVSIRVVSVNGGSAALTQHLVRQLGIGIVAGAVSHFVSARTKLPLRLAVVTADWLVALLRTDRRALKDLLARTALVTDACATN